MMRARKQRMNAGGYVGGVYFGHVPGTAIYEVDTDRGGYTVRATSRRRALYAVWRVEANRTRTHRIKCHGCGSVWCEDPSCAASKGA